MKYSVITGFLGRLQDRFTEYQNDRSLGEKFELASRIEGLDGLEVCYPADFADLKLLEDLLDKYSLDVSSLNVNLKKERRWANGSLTSLDEKIRQQAVNVLNKAMDLAPQIGCEVVTVCLLIDGHDYPFQVDYRRAWRYLVEGVREVCTHRDDVKLSIEYKMSEPVAHTIVGNVGKALYLCEEVGKDNVGVTLDLGHALYAGENPAESACLLAEKGRLFLVHINDNYRNWDWDLIPGFVNFWDYIEVFFYLREYGYQAWMSLDVFPKNIDPVEVFGRSIEFARNIERIVERISSEEIFQLINERNVPAIFSYLQNKSLNVG